jgi:hypothetical protein
MVTGLRVGKGSYKTVDELFAAWSDHVMIPVERIREIVVNANGANEIMAAIPDMKAMQSRSLLGMYRKLTGQLTGKDRDSMGLRRKQGGDGLPTGLSKVAPALKFLERLVQRKRTLEVEMEQVNAEILKYEGVARLADSLKREIDKLETTT